MQTLPGIAVSPSIAIGEMPIVDCGKFCIPQRFLSRDAVGDELACLVAAIHEVAANFQRGSGSVSLQLAKHIGAIFEALPSILLNQLCFLRSKLKKIVSELTLN